MSIKYLLKNKTRNLSLIIGVLVCTVILVIVHIVTNTIQNHDINDTIHNVGNYNFYTNNLNEKQLKILKKDNGVKYIGLEEFIGSTKSDNEVYEKLSGINNDYLKAHNLKLISGKLPSEKNEILVENWVADNLDLKENMKITLGLRLKDEDIFKDHSFKVVGILNDNYANKQKNYMRLYTKPWNKYTSNAFISINRDKSLNKCKSHLSKEIGINENLLIENNKVNSVIKEADQFSIKEIFICFCIFIILTLFIRGVYSISIINRINEFGTLRTLGMKNSGLFALIFFELLAIAIIGIIFGLLAGILIMNFFKADISILKTMLNIDVEGINNLNIEKIYLNKKLILYLLIPIFSSILVSIMQYFSIKSKSPIVLMNENENNFNENFKIKPRKNIFISNILLKISYNRISLNKGKTLLILLTLSLGSILFVMQSYKSQLLIYHNRQLLTNYANENIFDIKIGISDFNKKGINYEKLNKIKNIKDTNNKNAVKELVASSQKMGRLEIKENYNDYGDYIDKRNKDYDLYKGIIVRDNKKTYIKSSIFTYNDETMKKIYGVDNNLDAAILYLPEDFSNNNIFIDKDKNIEFISTKENEYKEDFIYGSENYNNMKHKKNEINISKVVTKYVYSGPYYTSNDVPQIIVSNSLYKKLFGDLKYDSINISLNKNIESEGISEQIIEEMRSYPLIVSNIFEQKEQAEIMEKRINIFMKFVIVILYLLAIINIMNLLSDMFISRKKELLTLKTIGASINQIKKMIIKESLFYVILSFFISLIISIISQYIYYYMHHKSWIFPPFYIEYKSIIYIGLINLFVVMFTTFISTRGFYCKKEKFKLTKKIH